MVFAVEPGIYVSEEKIGVRLENAIWVTDEEPRDLTKNIPIELEDIVDKMGQVAVQD